jgi:hypothetical protein
MEKTAKKYCNYQNTAGRKQSPIRRKVAKSGHRVSKTEVLIVEKISPEKFGDYD